jgi:hypothetical protein
VKKLTHKFVEYMPETLEPDVIYVSIRFGIVSHSCCCGCGNEVVTPISPTGWELTYNGETVSLNPSIGNWGLACRSHYWIIRNTVKWAEKWSKDRSRRVQESDALMRHRRLAQSEPAQNPTDERVSRPAPERQSIWSKLRGWWS